MTRINDPAIRKVKFFATKSDIEPGLCKFEKEHKVKYVRTGYYNTADVPEYGTALDIPDVGTSPSYLYYSCPKYLVLVADSLVNVTTIQLNAGGVRHEVEPSKHPKSFFVFFGGIFQGQKLIGGGCFVDSQDPDARARCLKYASYITEGFTQVRDPSGIPWQVGSEALVMLERGIPLQTHFTDREILSSDAIPKRKRT